MYRANFSTFVGIAALGASLYLLRVPLRLLSKAAGQIIGLPGIFLSLWASAALVITVSHRSQDNTIIGVKAAFRAAKGKYWRYFKAQIVYALIALIGFLLLVVPGVYWGTLFSFAPIAVVLEKDTAVNPFKISKSLIRGAFWRVFVLGLITTILFPLFCLLPLFFVFHRLQLSQPIKVVLGQIFMICYIPLLTIIQVTLYHTLKGREQAQQVVGAEASSQRGKEPGWLTAFGLFMLLIALTLFWRSRLGAYFKTEKGSRIVSHILEGESSKVAFPIAFPGGVTLEKPSGWLVIKRLGSEVGYDLMKLGNKVITDCTIRSIPLENPNDDPVIGHGISEEIVRREVRRMLGLSSKMYGPEGVRVLNLANHAWEEYTLNSTWRKMYGSKVNTQKHVYSIVNGSVLIASYRYTLQDITDETQAKRAKVDSKTEQLKKELLPKEEEEVRSILASMRFSAH